jgi:hypothetical protein
LQAARRSVPGQQLAGQNTVPIESANPFKGRQFPGERSWQHRLLGSLCLFL